MDIEVKWVALSENAETIHSVSTVQELRTKLCASRECFWTDIVMFDSHYNLIKETPENLNGPALEEMICLMKPKQIYTDSQWVELIVVHGLGGDEAGVERARKLIQEAGKDHVQIFTAASIKCVQDQPTVELLVKYGANLEKIIDEETTVEDTQKLQDACQLLAGLGAGAKDEEPSEENVEMVSGLLTGIDSFVSRGLQITEAPKAPASPQPKVSASKNKKKKKGGAQEETKVEEKEKEPEIKNDNLNAMISEGVITEVLKLLPSKSEKIRQSALAIISKPTNSPQKDLLADNNVFTYLLEAINTIGDAAALEYLTFVNSILQGSRRRVTTASQSTFLARLLELINSTDSCIRLKSIVALETAVNNANLEVFTCLYDDDLTQKLLDFIQGEDMWAEEDALARGETHPFGIALRLLVLCCKKTKEGTFVNNVALQTIEKADILTLLLESDNMDITREALKLHAIFAVRDTEQAKAEKLRQLEEKEKKTEEEASVEEEASTSLPLEVTSNQNAESTNSGEVEEVSVEAPMTNGIHEKEALTEESNDVNQEEVEKEESPVMRNRKGQQGNRQSNTGMKKKRTKGRLGGQKTADLSSEEPAEEGSDNAGEKPNDFLLLLTRYLAIILAFFGNFFGTIMEHGAQAFVTVTDVFGNALQDVCPKRTKSRRKAPTSNARA